jgi:hypothetical protein
LTEKDISISSLVYKTVYTMNQILYNMNRIK